MNVKSISKLKIHLVDIAIKLFIPFLFLRHVRIIQDYLFINKYVFEKILCKNEFSKTKI